MSSIYADISDFYLCECLYIIYL